MSLRKVKCPYLSVIGQNYLQCTLHCRIVENKTFRDSKELHDYTDNICYGGFDLCNTYLKTYDKEINSTDKYILEFRYCSFCCNSSGYTGLKINDGSTHCFCQLKQDEMERHNPNTLCGWFNRHHNMVCKYFGGLIKDGKKYKIKCGENCNLAWFESEKDRDNYANDVCINNTLSCRAFIMQDLKDRGIETCSGWSTEKALNVLLAARLKNGEVKDFDIVNDVFEFIEQLIK